MLIEVLLAVVQAATEFLPVSSSGHLALVSNLISFPDLFFFTMLHLASLFAVLVYTRKETWKLISFDKKYKKMWGFLVLATIPAALVGYFFGDFFGAVFESYLVLGVTFFATGLILLSTKDAKTFSKLNWKNSLGVGIAQIFAIFPGISRSGTTISAARFLGVSRDEAFKFSFLMFIPLALGAVILEFGNAYFSWGLLVSFLVCFGLSLFFLSWLRKVVVGGKFWIFGFYCFLISLVSFILYFLKG